LQGTAVRLIGIDVDGTLVGATGVVHPSIWATAQSARERGIHLVLCSGRPAFGVALGYAHRLDPDGWHVFQNGASIVHLATGTSSDATGSSDQHSIAQSRSAPLSSDSVATLIARARSSGEVLELYGDDTYVIESTSAWAQAHAELLGVPFAPRSFESLTQPVVRAQWLLSSERAAQYMSAPHPGLEVAQSTSPLMPDTQFVGITKEGVSKGNAIRSVAAAYGILLGDVMYVGDAGNDLSALRIVGHPVAMANADPAVRKVAAHLVGHVDEGGLAQALEMAVAMIRE
jgi:Cof subfamily protein (haloacid dehalogenase superfamily)